MPDPIETAAANFAQGYACSQAVLTAYAQRYGMDHEQAMAIAASFGGGMGRLGQTCGAISGAIMVIGLAVGNIDPADKAAKDRCYALVQEFGARFRAEFGELTCPGLLGYQIGNEAQRLEANEKGLFKSLCPQYVERASALLAEILPA